MYVCVGDEGTRKEKHGINQYLRPVSSSARLRIRLILTLQPETITDLWRYVPDSIAAMATLAFSEDVLLVPRYLMMVI